MNPIEGKRLLLRKALFLNAKVRPEETPINAKLHL